jgi:DnaK suppressor protein
VKKDPPAPHHSPARGGSLQEGRLADERAAALAQIEALTREFDSVVAASKTSNADDEHDPEGATIAFERQQVVALLDQARRRLADVDAALAHSEAGDYGICETCGRPIAPERLAARPAARTCITCAR